MLFLPRRCLAPDHRKVLIVKPDRGGSVADMRLLRKSLNAPLRLGELTEPPDRSRKLSLFLLKPIRHKLQRAAVLRNDANHPIWNSRRYRSLDLERHLNTCSHQTS